MSGNYIQDSTEMYPASVCDVDVYPAHYALRILAIY